jgi:predicted MFS family arabinose efflux permease
MMFPKKQEQWMLFTLAAINFTNIMDFMIMMPLGPQLMRTFQITPQQFGLVVSSYTISAGVSGFFTAFIIDRFERKRFLMWLYAGFMLGTLACGLSTGYIMLTSARIFTGLFGGVLGAVILSIIGDTVPFERRGKAMGLVMAAFSVASVLGVPFGLYLATTFSWQTPFLGLAILAIPVLVGVWKLVPNINTHIHDAGSRSIKQVITGITSDANQRKAITLMMVIMFGHFSIIPFLSPYMVSNVGFTEHQLSYIYLFGGALNIFTAPLIGRMADKRGKRIVFQLFVSLSTIPVFIITNMPAWPLWVALIFTTLFFVMSGGRFIPAQAMVTATVNPQNRGSFMSIVSSVQQLSAGLASYLAGIIVAKQADGTLVNYNWVGAISIASAIFTIYLVTRIRMADGGKF